MTGFTSNVIIFHSEVQFLLLHSNQNTHLTFNFIEKMPYTVKHKIIMIILIYLICAQHKGFQSGHRFVENFTDCRKVGNFLLFRVELKYGSRTSNLS